ncbi:MAG TPA: hypothetical protein GX702_12785 [Chloroflexi bacterium]|jgi:hypothetical protein|nr:hypothetical protein [Chloroflexota bacterium]
MKKRRYPLAFVTLIAFLLSIRVVSAQSVNVLRNGSFEGEFVHGVGEGWTAFHNGGDASYGYGADDRASAVFDGDYTQLLEIHTLGVGGSQPDRYSGIYQTATVVPGASYMFSVYGMVRSSVGSAEGSNYNYRLYVGFDYDGGTDPQRVTEWHEFPWSEYEIESPGPLQSYSRGVTATSDRITVFIRALKKFPTVGERVLYNLDAVSLVGPDGAVHPAEAAADAPMLPQTGAGSVLTLVGVALASLALGIRRLRTRD